VLVVSVLVVSVSGECVVSGERVSGEC
jgi:hypothetical protein